MPEGHEHVEEHLDADSKRLAELGYRQDLNRGWSGFSNFAISFSIISILAGCFTNFGAGWNNGGPISISWSWPILSAFILLIGFTMSELVSAYPTSGGIYWGASKLGGPAGGFYTGGVILVGLEARRPSGRCLHRVAEPGRSDRGHGRCLLRLRHVHRPHHQHCLEEL